MKHYGPICNTWSDIAVWWFFFRGEITQTVLNGEELANSTTPTITISDAAKFRSAGFVGGLKSAYFFSIAILYMQVAKCSAILIRITGVNSSR